MKCQYHLRVLEPSQPSPIPFDSDLAGTVRTTLRCPIPGCPTVGIEYDAERTQPNRCKCGRSLGERADSLCHYCSSLTYRRAKAAMRVRIARDARARSDHAV